MAVPSAAREQQFRLPPGVPGFHELVTPYKCTAYVSILTVALIPSARQSAQNSMAQIGARPGSIYLLLSRGPAEGLIEKFNVLQVACPRDDVRDAGSLDILLTRYCAVDSRNELIRLVSLQTTVSQLNALSATDSR